MKINITKELDEDTLLSHIVLHSLSHAVADELVQEGKTDDGIVCDIKLTVNGRDIDIQSFVEYWQSQVGDIIIKKAKELIDNKFTDINDMLYDLEERIRPEINKRLEDWEEEDK